MDDNEYDEYGDPVPSVSQTPGYDETLGGDYAEDGLTPPLAMPGVGQPDGNDDAHLGDNGEAPGGDYGEALGEYDGGEQLDANPEADPLAAAGDYDGFNPPATSTPPRYAGDKMAYDFPGGGESASPDGGMLNASVGLGASSGGVDEEIDIDTHGLIDETVQRLSFIHGVLGVMIVDRDGLIVHATMPLDEAARLAGPTLTLLQRAKGCAALANGDELQMLCVRTRKYELLLCSEADGAFAICVLQDPSPEKAADATDAPITSAARSVLRASVGMML